MNARPLSELVAQAEEWLVSRGQSANAVSQYHYIFRVFLSWFQSFHEERYSEELMERCLREHYGIADAGKTFSRRQHYKKKVIRASKLLKDLHDGKTLENRYVPPKSPLKTEAYNDALAEFRFSLEKRGRGAKTIESYLRYAGRFLDFSEQRNLLRFSDFSVQSVRDYAQTLSGCRKQTVKSTLGALRIFLRFLYANGRLEQDLSRFVDKVPVREQTGLPSVWTREEVLKLLYSNFHRFLRKAGISYGGRGKGPRPYDFRHTFAVRTLKRMVLSGKDPETYHQALKTYMGHSFFKYTAYYLQLTKDMFPDIRQKIESRFQSLYERGEGHD